MYPRAAVAPLLRWLCPLGKREKALRGALAAWMVTASAEDEEDEEDEGVVMDGGGLLVHVTVLVEGSQSLSFLLILSLPFMRI